MKYYLIAGLMLVLSMKSIGQWESLNGPDGGLIRTLKSNDKYLFAGSSAGLFRSSDGKAWDLVQLKQGTQDACKAIGINDNILVAFSLDFYLSQNNGDTWQPISKPPAQIILDIVITDYAIYACSFTDLWYSTDYGESWQLSSFPIDSANIFCITSDHGRVFIGSTGKVYVSSSDADDWQYINIGNTEAQVHNLFIEDSLIFVIDPYSSQFMRSIDFGQHWLVDEDPRWKSDYIQIIRLQDIYFISLEKRIIKSINRGVSWTDCESKFYEVATQMVPLDTSLFIGTFYKGVMRSEDYGTSFYPSTEGIPCASVGNITFHEDAIIAASDYNGIFDFKPGNQLWGQQYNDTSFFSYFDDLLEVNGSLYASSESKYVYHFDDTSQNWDLISDSTFSTVGKLNNYFDTLVVYSDGFKAWKPNLQKWMEFDALNFDDTIKLQNFTYNTNFVFGCDSHQLFRKSIVGNDWIRVLLSDTIPLLSNYRIQGIYAIANKLFIQMVINFDSQEYRILMSEDQGLTWNFAEDGFPELQFPWWSGLGSMVEINSYVLSTGRNYSLGVVVSSLDKIHWYSFNDGLPSLSVNDLAYDDEYIYAGLTFYGVWRRKISDLEISSTETIPDHKSYQFFPNPTSTYLEVTNTLMNADNLDYLLTDVTGRIIKIDKIPDTNFKIDVSELPNGIYFIMIYGANERIVQKIIVHH